jgi:hypothetical protein
MQTYAPHALELIRDMGTKATYEPNSKHINDCGEYSALYKGLHDVPDIAIHELFLEGKIKRGDKKPEKVNDGRLFYYRVDNTVYIVAVRASHYNTTKGKH